MEPEKVLISLEAQVKYWKERCDELGRENRRLRLLLTTKTDAIQNSNNIINNSSQSTNQKRNLSIARPPVDGDVDNDDDNLSESDSASSSLSNRAPEGLLPSLTFVPGVDSRGDAFENVNDVDLIIESGDCKAGSLSRLVDRLTAEEGRPLDVNDFLLVYPSFTIPILLLETLIERYKAAKDIFIAQVKVLNVLKTWCTVYWSDFVQAIDVKQRTIEFLQSIVEHNPTQVNTILSKIESYSSIHESRTSLSTSLIPMDDGCARNPNWLVLTEDPLDIAQQLTLRDWEHWKEIRPIEFFNLGWTKARKDETSPNVVAMTRMFNELSSWTVAAVVTTENKPLRVKVVQNLLLVAKHLKSLGNFNSMMAVLSGLDRGPVYRLKQTMDVLLPSSMTTVILGSKKFAALWAETKYISSQGNNSANLRAAVKNSNPPLIPYLGMYLTDITFIEEGNPDKRGELINYRKCTLLSETLRQVKQYQLKGYSFKPDPLFHLSFQQFKYVLDDDILYELSHYIEPRDGKAVPERPVILDVMRARDETLSAPELEAIAWDDDESASESFSYAGLKKKAKEVIYNKDNSGSRQRAQNASTRRKESVTLDVDLPSTSPMSTPTADPHIISDPLYEPPVDFEGHLRDPIGFDSFSYYLSSPVLKRSLSFVVAVESLKKEEDRDKILWFCREIYSNFFSTASSDRITLPDSLMESLKDALRNSYSKAMYDGIASYLRSEHLDSNYTSYQLTRDYEQALINMRNDHLKHMKRTSSTANRKGVKLAHFLSRKRRRDSPLATSSSNESPNSSSRIDNQLLDQLLTLGIDQSLCVRALQATDNNLERAIAYVFNPPAVDVDGEKLSRLMQLGIDSRLAQESLQACDNDFDRAMQHLLTTQEQRRLQEQADDSNGLGVDFSGGLPSQRSLVLPSADPAAHEQMLALGIDPLLAERALRRNNNDVSLALANLVETTTTDAQPTQSNDAELGVDFNADLPYPHSHLSTVITSVHSKQTPISTTSPRSSQSKKHGSRSKDKDKESAKEKSLLERISKVAHSDFNVSKLKSGSAHSKRRSEKKTTPRQVDERIADPELLGRLLSLGFDATLASEALRTSGNEMELAIRILLEQKESGQSTKSSSKQRENEEYVSPF